MLALIRLNLLDKNLNTAIKWNILLTLLANNLSQFLWRKKIVGDDIMFSIWSRIVLSSSSIIFIN